MPSEPKPSLGRRRFLIQTGSWLGFGVALLVIAWDALRYVAPPIAVRRRRKVFVSNLSDIPEGEVRTTADLAGRPLVILHVPGQEIIALSLVCTHLGCRVNWQSESRTFLCPCHGGRFDSKGKVLSGPPPAPLAKYELSVENDSLYIELPEAD